MAGLEDVKVGKKILIDGAPFEVLKAEHLKVAMGKGMEKCTLRNLLTGKVIPKTFREVDTVEEANIRYFSSEYTYHDGEGYHFMNTETYDEVILSDEQIGDNKFFLVEGDKVKVMEWDEKPINVELPPSVTLEVVDTPPGERGDTATGGSKPATLNTGLVVKVPLFMKIGEQVRVDTRTHEYLGRA